MKCKNKQKKHMFHCLKRRKYKNPHAFPRCEVGVQNDRCTGDTHSNQSKDSQQSTAQHQAGTSKYHTPRHSNTIFLEANPHRTSEFVGRKFGCLVKGLETSHFFKSAKKQQKTVLSKSETRSASMHSCTKNTLSGIHGRKCAESY